MWAPWGCFSLFLPTLLDDAPFCILEQKENRQNEKKQNYVLVLTFLPPQMYRLHSQVERDFLALAEDVVLHRIRLNYEALADGRRGDVCGEGP